jgi:hypothetical protein
MVMTFATIVFDVDEKYLGRKKIENITAICNGITSIHDTIK